MKAFRDRIGRLHIIAMLAAIVSTIGVIAATSTTNAYLTTAMRGHDARLQEMSERAERIQLFARHIRKASLTSTDIEVDLPFGGFVGAASRIELGARLKLVQPGNTERTLEVLSVSKAPHTFGVAADTSLPSIELFTVSGRALWVAGEPVIRIMVAATPEKPATTGIVGTRTL